jgi:hypothetical protein
MRHTTSASNIDRRARCHGSARMEAGIVEPEDSDISREGTALHAYDADPKLIPAGLTSDQRALLTTSRKLSEIVFAEAAKTFGIAADEPFEEAHELEMWLHAGIRALYPGHCDHLRWYPRVRLLVIVDKKFGFKEVSHAAANLQLRSYACMGAELYPAETVLVAITQPRLPFEQRLTMAAYNRDEIAAARRELAAIVKATQAPDAPLRASEEACRYCKAKLVCEAYRSKFSALHLQRASEQIEACTDAQLDEVLIAIQFADFIKDQARDEARRRIAEGGFTQWQMGKEVKQAGITDHQRARELLTAAGYSEKAIDACYSARLGAIEEMVHARDGGTEREAKDTARTLLADVLKFTPKRAALTRVKAS